MKFTVEGADAKTGREKTIVVNGYDKADAEQQGRAAGLLIHRVTPADNAPPARLATAALASPGTISGLAGAPDYAGLRMVSRIFFAAAVLSYLCGVLLLIWGIIQIIQAMQTQDPEQKAAAILICEGAIGVFFGGIINHGVSEFLGAFRDMARNSFRQ
ncbi:MAG: DUF308 domain-containing protein [Tepidisphaeraceae bacterium]|jgi:hypothetical protein